MSFYHQTHSLVNGDEGLIPAQVVSHKEMNKRIGPKVKQEWNIAVHELHNFFFGGGGGCHKHISVPLGPM